MERIFWDYTLDFIAVKHIGIMDLIDIYFLLGLLGCGVGSAVASATATTVGAGLAAGGAIVLCIAGVGISAGYALSSLMN